MLILFGHEQHIIHRFTRDDRAKVPCGCNGLSVDLVEVKTAKCSVRARSRDHQHSNTSNIAAVRINSDYEPGCET